RSAPPRSSLCGGRARPSPRRRARKQWKISSLRCAFSSYGVLEQKENIWSSGKPSERRRPCSIQQLIQAVVIGCADKRRDFFAEGARMRCGNMGVEGVFVRPGFDDSKMISSVRLLKCVVADVAGISGRFD